LDILKNIDALDKACVIALDKNQTEWLDTLMIFFSHKWMPIPIYAFLLYLLYKHLAWKNLLFIVVPALVVTISLADYTSSGIFKPWIARLRPCYAIDGLHLPNGCGGQFGFFSSHAANSFAVATLIFMLLKDKQKHILTILLCWAVPVSFSRIYLSVHYPSDILVGCICGILYGLLVAYFSNKLIDKFQFT
jgi:undecaprenyl-diphosphatase